MNYLSLHTRAVRIHGYGDPGVMELTEVTLPAPGPQQIRIRQCAMGVNFIDIMQRRGVGAIALPSGLGFEAVGVVTAVGADVRYVRVGERVAYMHAGIGAYAEDRNVDASRVVAVPDSITDEASAAVFFKGMTAQYLLRKTARISAADTVVVHAAAGGVGQILCRWAKHLGATVIGTVGSDAKREAALSAGCDSVVNYSDANWAQAVIELTGGNKATVVYDSIGKDTLLGSLDCARQFGMVVVYGNASGPAPAITPEQLNQKGCLFLTRPSVFPHNANSDVFRANAREVFEAVSAGALVSNVGGRFALADVALAHAAVEARVAGSIVLTSSH